MKRCVFITLLFAFSGPSLHAGPLLQNFDKAGFYAVMASGKLRAVDSELSVLANSTVKEQQAYEGALLMRKAGLLGRAREKLAAFRAGAVKLEGSIARDSTNAEYHFLRLMIQEHAPRVVHYNQDMGRDGEAVIHAFHALSPVLQQAIRNYCPHSRILKENELNG